MNKGLNGILLGTLAGFVIALLPFLLKLAALTIISCVIWDRWDEYSYKQTEENEKILQSGGSRNE